jgi:two-component system phosphate regulon sensor histidine kinase PhoR
LIQISDGRWIEVMRRFRTRLTVIFITLIGFSVLSSGIFMVRMVEDAHLDTLRTSMLRELRVIAAETDWAVDGDIAEQRAQLSKEAVRLKVLSGERITFIDIDGQVLGDSDHNAAEMDDHLDRVEVKESMRNGVGYSIRKSETIGHDMLYAAIPVAAEGGETIGYLRLAVSLAEVEATTNRMWTVLFSGLLAYFIIAGLISYRIAGGLSKRLEKATEVTKQIASHNYSARVLISGKDEFGQMAQSINAMAASLQLQMNKIREGESRLMKVVDNLISGVLLVDVHGTFLMLNRTAEDMIGQKSKELIGQKFEAVLRHQDLTALIMECMTTRERISDDLMIFYPQERILEASIVPMDEDGIEVGLVIVLHDITAIRRLERMRSEFVANVSHELRTPITAVRGFAETLLAGAMDDKETAKSFLEIIYEESDRLNRLIEDTLALSNIESKRTPLTFAPIHLAPFVSQVLEMVRGTAVKKNIDLEYNIDEELHLEADEDRMRQILINLLSNAINYTPEGGHVLVSVQGIAGNGMQDAEDEKIRMIVKDSGIGIPRKDIPRIFERFYRVDKARSRGSGGTGLGLSIVKHLVELHKGTIRVDSMVGVGTSFIVELPVLQDAQ